jgi:hypothetical protein
MLKAISTHFFNLRSLLLRFGIPCGLWLFLFRDQLTGQALIVGELVTDYASIKYYLDNLRTGVYPLWDPYHLWGTPNGDLGNLGPFNPLWLLTLGLNVLGFSFYHAFVGTLTAYFFIGTLGLYQVAQTLIKQDQAAYLAFLLFLFSSMSLQLFAKSVALVIYVPAIWFFYFVLRFAQVQERGYFVGMMFTLMVIVTTYLPFYFLTVFLLVGMLSLALFFQDSKRFLGQTLSFVRKCPWTAGLSFLALIFSFIPPWLFYRSVRSQDIVVPFRHSFDQEMEHQGLELSYQTSTHGGISAYMSLKDLYANLDELIYGNEGFFYISAGAYIIFVLAGVVRFNRRAVLWLGFSLIMLLISITNVTPVYAFLFKQIPFFSYFRNHQYFLPFLLSGVILLVAEQFYLLHSQRQSLFARWGWGVIWIAGVHVGMMTFLFFQQAVILSTYLTVFFSLLFFLSWYLYGGRLSQTVWYILFWIVFLIQPMEVFWHHNAQARYGRSDILPRILSAPRCTAEFSYQRPRVSPVTKQEESSYEPLYYYQWYKAVMKDSPGFFMPYAYALPTRWAYLLSQQADLSVLRQYTQYKFIAYDRIREVTDNEENVELIAKSFIAGEGWAYVHSPRSASVADVSQSVVHPPLVLTGETSDFQLTHFDVNSISMITNFSQPKFLVYNDSYTPLWKAWLNGKETELYRANVAFKGLWLPSGKNEVLLRYRPPAGQGFYLGLLGLFTGMFLWLGWILSQMSRTTCERQ